MLLNRRMFLAGAIPAAVSIHADPAGGLDDFHSLLPKRIPRRAVFRQEDYMVWGTSVVRTADGTCHMYFARWPTALGFNSWATHSEVAYATAPQPEGPFTFHSVALPARGAGYWDGHMTHNVYVLAAKGKFYLYYTGNYGPDSWRPDVPASKADWWIHRNHQRVGVAVADHPAGPWKRFDKPLLDTPEYGFGLTAAPCVIERPDGKFVIYYKTLVPGEGNVGGGVFHYPAVGSSPLGPFVKYPKPMIDKSKIFHQHFNFHIDDHQEWYENGRYYAIVKDHDAPHLTKYGKSLCLMESDDSLNWRIAEHPLVTPFALEWDDGKREEFERLEMPAIFLEKGRPRVLYLAALPTDDPSQHSFDIAIPLHR